LYKTSLVAENLLIRLLQRAKELTLNGEQLEASKALLFFLNNSVSKSDFNNDILNTFAQLDDVDILAAMKAWQHHDDFVFKNLSQIIMERELLKIKFKNHKVTSASFEKHIKDLMVKYNISHEEASYFVFGGDVTNQAYQSTEQKINILLKTGKVKDIIKASDHLNLKVLSKPVTKYYICYPKAKL